MDRAQLLSGLRFRGTETPLGLGRDTALACASAPEYTLTAGDSQSDPEGAQFREAWERAEGLWYDDPDDPRSDALDEPLTEAFISLLERVVQRLHAGDVQRIFGKTLPVLIHELEYYEEIAAQNLRANPPGAVPDGFVQWGRGE